MEQEQIKLASLVRYSDKRSLAMFASDLQNTPEDIQADILAKLMLSGMIRLPLRYCLLRAIVGREAFAQRLREYFRRAPADRAANWARFLHHLVDGEADGDDETCQGGYNREELAAILSLFEAHGYVATAEAHTAYSG